MREIYFINVIGNLNTVAWVLFSVLCLAAFVIGFAYSCNDIHKEFAKKALKTIVIIASACLLAGAFLPTKKDMYIIYGVGSVVDYLQENEEAKQLPDKTIKALNAFADKYTQTKEEEQ